LRDVYKRIRIPLPDRSLFDTALEVLRPKGMLRLLLAKVDGRPIGALTLLLYRGVIYYWYTGTLREFASCRAGDFLVWHTLEWGAQNGFHTFDFGGGAALTKSTVFAISKRNSAGNSLVSAGIDAYMRRSDFG